MSQAATTKQSITLGIRAGPPERPVILFHYNVRRNYYALEQWLRPRLAEFQGVIVTGEHAPHNMPDKNPTGIRACGGCLAHCCRNFGDASKTQKRGSVAYKVMQNIAINY